MSDRWPLGTAARRLADAANSRIDELNTTCVVFAADILIVLEQLAALSEDEQAQADTGDGGIPAVSGAASLQPVVVSGLDVRDLIYVRWPGDARPVQYQPVPPSELPGAATAIREACDEAVAALDRLTYELAETRADALDRLTYELAETRAELERGADVICELLAQVGDR